MPKGKALDLMQSSPVMGFDSNIVGTTSYDDTEGSDVVVVTAGLPRKPGMSRDDLLGTNAKIMTSVCEEIRKSSDHAVVIVVSNPLDAMVPARPAGYRFSAGTRHRSGGSFGYGALSSVLGDGVGCERGRCVRPC